MVISNRDKTGKKTKDGNKLVELGVFLSIFIILYFFYMPQNVRIASYN